MENGTADLWARQAGRGANRRAVAMVTAGGLLAALAGRSAAVPAQAQNATPAGSSAACPLTSPEENKELVRRYWDEVWTAGGDARVDELLAADEVHHWGVGGDTVGHDAFAERLRAFLTAFPNFAIRVDHLVAEGDQVVSRWTATGTHEGAWLGIAATGRRVEYSGMNLFRIACGKIAESWGEADHLGLLRQIGGAAEVSTPAVGTPTS